MNLIECKRLKSFKAPIFLVGSKLTQELFEAEMKKSSHRNLPISMLGDGPT